MREKNNLHATMHAMADEYCKLKEQIEFLLLPDQADEDDQDDLICNDHGSHGVARSQGVSRGWLPALLEAGVHNKSPETV